ncbi:MAG: hypothetical protein V4773_12250 [Verrucomicrobiota bacterium]
MARFIHLTDERLLARLKKSGIRMSFWGREKLRCVYAVPVLPDFQVSYQWLRELKNRGVRTMGALHFKIPDGEEVLVGRFSEEPVAMTAAQAVRVFMEHPTGMGLQVLVRRRIEAKEITRTYVPPQIVGWRYYPEAHGKPPFCGCEFCQRGLIKNRKLREKYRAENPG